MPKQKKILVLSATAGAGHLRAGEALVETCKSLSLPVIIEHRDILDFTFPLFKNVYSQINNAIVSKSPELWGYLYKKTGKSKPKPAWMKIFDHFNYKKYLQFLNDYQPDAVICTHFLPYIAIIEELQKSSWKIPFFSVPTDYDAHSLWVSPYIKHFYVATDEVAWTVASYGIKDNYISTTGIPVAPVFRKKNNKRNLRKEFSLPPSPFTIFIFSGGYGVGVIDRLVPSVVNFLSSYERKQFQIIVVCGKNKKLFDELSQIIPATNIGLKVFPYVTFVDKLMDCSDVLITKSGGLTVSEALAKHLPMVIFDPFPGQEGRNANYLTENGAALQAANFDNLHYKLKLLIENYAQLSTMKSNARAIAKPNAAKMILEDVLKRI